MNLFLTTADYSNLMEVSYSSFRLKAELIRCCWAVGKVEIAPLLRDFQAEWTSPAVGLFLGASFSTAVLPTNCAKDPKIGVHSIFVWARTQDSLSKKR